MLTKFLSSLMAIVMLAIIPFQSYAETSSVQQFELTKGTTVALKIQDQITSDGIGEVNAIVDQDVYSADGGTILIKAGAPAFIKATYKKNGAPGKAGQIILNSATTQTVDGKTINLAGNLVEKGKGKGGLAWGLGIGVGCVTLIGLLFLLIKGGEATIPAGTIIPTTVAANYSCNI